MIYLTDPQVLTAEQCISTHCTYRYMVQLASKEVDYEGVPERTQLIDLVVKEPTPEAIALLLEASGYLKDWQIASYWQPTDGCTEF